MLVCLQVAGLLGFTTVLGTRDCAPLPSPRCAALVIWLVAHMTRCASLHVDVVEGYFPPGSANTLLENSS